MTISIIVAMDSNQTIGNDGKLPWFLPEDLKYFRKKTLDRTVVMGRKTFDSIGKALPQRTNIVLTRDVNWEADNVVTFNSVKDVLDWTKDVICMEQEDDEFFIIGGGDIFHQFYPNTDRLYVTHIDHDFEGQTQWTGFKWSEWRLVHSEKGPKNEENPYDYWFSVYEREGKY